MRILNKLILMLIGSFLFISMSVHASEIFWSDTFKIQSADLDQKTPRIIINNVSSFGMAVDPTDKKIYFTDYTNGKIQRANFDGSQVETLISGLTGPESIVLDLNTKKIYWGVSEYQHRGIWRANLDGSQVEPLISSQDLQIGPTTLALDLANGKMYWGDNLDDKIYRSDLNGAKKETFISNFSFNEGMYFDDASRKLYILQGIITTVRGMRIVSVEVDKGNAVKELFSRTGSNYNLPKGFFYDEVYQTYYFGMTGNNGIFSAIGPAFNPTILIPNVAAPYSIQIVN
jgi:hypothetical protein